MAAPHPPPDTVRGLAWQHLHAVGRPRVGDAAWDDLVRAAGGPEAARIDPFENLPLEPYLRALAALQARLGAGDGGDGAVLRDLARGSVALWAGTYRSLVRRVQGDPARLLEVFCAEVHPWFLDDPGAGAVVDAGPAVAIVALRSRLPDAFKEGLLEGAVAAAGVPGARAARRGEHFVVTWEAGAADGARPGTLARLASVVRVPFLAAAVVPVLVGAALAWKDGRLDLGYLGLTLGGVAALQLAANAANDYFDHRSRADEENLTPTPYAGGSRAIQRGLLSPRAVLAVAAACYAAGTAIGLHVAFHLQWDHGTGLAQVLGLGVAGFLLGFLYTAPPVRLAHRGFGELAVGLGFGPLIVAGTYLVQSVQAGAGAVVSLEALAYSVPVGALVAAVLVINQFPDRPWDARAGKRTLVVRLAARKAIWGYGALLALAYGSIAAAALAFRAWPVLLALLTLPLAVRAWRLLNRNHGAPYKLVPASAATLAVHLTTGLLLLGGIVLARLSGGT